jgi:cation transport regulator ChaC
VSASTWVFGYGSLVSPASLARTLGRGGGDIRATPAELIGFGRRWNYGSLTLRGSWRHHDVLVDGIVISLGLESAEAETCNGVVVQVTDDELARLDWRERDYQRTDVTEQIRTGGDCAAAVDGQVVTYVPRPSAVERYLAARDDGRAAVRLAYWDLVHDAFSRLGHTALDRFTSHTPAPDVPIADVHLAPVEPSTTAAPAAGNRTCVPGMLSG